MSWLYMIADAIMDNITFHRVHLAKHPFRDYWHLKKHVARLSLFLAGVAFTSIIVTSIILKFFVLMTAILVIWLAYVALLKTKWNKIALSPDTFYFDKDETMKITTGCKILDKWLGFHW